VIYFPIPPSRGPKLLIFPSHIGDLFGAMVHVFDKSNLSHEEFED